MDIICMYIYIYMYAPVEERDDVLRGVHDGEPLARAELEQAVPASLFWGCFGFYGCFLLLCDCFICLSLFCWRFRHAFCLFVLIVVFVVCIYVCVCIYTYIYIYIYI